VETFEYTSSVDGARPLYADASFRADGKPKPLLVVMHGYNGSRMDVRMDVTELSAKGVFAVAPDCRGRGGSAGVWDSGRFDVHDILDATLAAVKQYPADIDPRNLNIVGYSGGGGNTIACAVRFPDLFQTCVSFFGISDYAWWHRSNGRPDCNAVMEEALGGPPEAIPEVYTARNANPAAANATLARLHFFWDEEETQCPVAMVEEFIANYRSAGLTNVAVHVSHRGDANRWHHGYRSDHGSLRDAADSLFLPDVLAEKSSSPRLAPRGRLVVPGYLVTRRFQVWIEDGRQGQAVVEYDLRGRKPALRVVENPGNHKIRLLESSPLGNQT